MVESEDHKDARQTFQMVAGGGIARRSLLVGGPRESFNVVGSLKSLFGMKLSQTWDAQRAIQDQTTWRVFRSVTCN